MKHQPQKYSYKELLAIFPEAKKIIPLKIKECKETIKEKEQKIATILGKIYMLETDGFSEWFCEQIVKMFLMPALTKTEKNLFRLNSFQYLLSPQTENNGRQNFQAQIEIARLYPIAELARGKLELRQAGKNWVGLCPIHNEKHASFILYTDSNSCHCYGCGFHGDVINLTMALHGLNFKEAVARLQN
jgi:hypothetical protein